MVKMEFYKIITLPTALFFVRLHLKKIDRP